MAEELLRQLREVRAEEDKGAQTIKSAYAEGRFEIAIKGIEEKRVRHKVSVVDLDVGAVGISREGPSFAAGVAARSERVEEEERRSRMQAEGLFLLVNRVGKAVERIGGVDEKRILAQICGK